MNFELTERGDDFKARLLAFMSERIYPAEAVMGSRCRSRKTLTFTRRSSRSSSGRPGGAGSGTCFTPIALGARA